MKMKIVGMLSTYNEEDFVENVIKHLLNQGLELVILDNGSTDNTFEICKKFVNKGVLNLEQFQSSTYQWAIILIKLDSRSWEVTAILVRSNDAASPFMV